jgi:hypothetical protein
MGPGMGTGRCRLAAAGKVTAMESFDGRQRRELRAGLPLGERRSAREAEPLEQRLDRWMQAGRQLVDGVSGGRPGSRSPNRRPEARPGGRRGLDGLGRWVEDRLDWLIDDSDDWREPWQEGEIGPRPSTGARAPAPQAPVPGATALRADASWASGPGATVPTATAPRVPVPGPPVPRFPASRAPVPGAGGPGAGSTEAVPVAVRRRRPLDARSRRGSSGLGSAAAASSPPPATDPAPQITDGRRNPDPAGIDHDHDWPDQESFVLQRWRRPTAPLPRQQPGSAAASDPDAPLTRPLPRSSRRR